MFAIADSVGKNGKNNAADVKKVQDAINANPGFPNMPADGRYGPTTFKAILQYQMAVFPSEKDWDGLISPNGQTSRALNNPLTRITRQVPIVQVEARASKLGGHGASGTHHAGGQATPASITPLRTVSSSYKGLSGAAWCKEFQGSSSTDDLASPFRENVKKFISALGSVGVTPHIAATFRPLERAYLMHWSYRIAEEGYDPTKVPAQSGVNINWVHVDAKGNYDAKASKAAAQAMVDKYSIDYAPSLTSNHISGNAIDMKFNWGKKISIVDGNNKTQEIAAGNSVSSDAMHKIGASYDVLKLVTDKPHWSYDGR